MSSSLFRDRDFRLVTGAVGLSAAGDWVAIVALGLFVGEQTDSGWLVAALWICLFGPSIVVSGVAGLLVDRIETTRLLAMLADAATFVAVALAAHSLRIKRPPGELREGEAAPRARDGIACLYRDSTLSLVMTVAFGSLFFMSAVWVGELFFVEDVLEMGDVAYASMFSVWTVGMALGAMLLSRRVAVTALAAVGLAAAAIQGASLALPALWLSFAFYLACAFVGGTAHGVKNVMYRSLIHVRVPENLHGRAFAAYNAIRNTAELGAFAAGGFLVTAIGARGTLAYAGGLSALAGLIGLLALLRLKESGPKTEIASVPPN
jgi:hypothetical protein